MKKFGFSKKVGAVLFALAVTVSSASAVEFTVGGKLVGDVSFYTTYYEEEYMSVGLGGSVFSAIDFLQFGICKLGVRPEVVAYYSPIYILTQILGNTKACVFLFVCPSRLHLR